METFRKLLITGLASAALASLPALAQTASDKSTTDTTPPSSTSPSADTTTPSSTSPSADRTLTGSDKATHKDSAFIKDAFEGNQLEAAMAQAGARKVQNADLKSFCEHIQKDHTMANEKLQAIAQKLNVDLDAADAQKKADKEAAKYERMSSKDFDKEFATAALKDHQEDIAKYEKASEKTQNADVRQYIQETLPKLQQHFEHAVQAARAVGVEESTIAKYSEKMHKSVGGTADDSKTSKGAGARELQPNPTTP